MASLVLLRNPLAPHTREIHALAAGTPVIDWLQQEHPRGFGMPVRFYVNGAEKCLEDLDYPVADDDVAVIALMPGIDPASITLESFLIQLAIAAVLSAASLALNYFFAPKEQSGPKAKGDAASIYNITADQNGAKLGEVIPVIYGNVLMSPDYISQPYAFYSWSQAAYNQSYTGVQYLDMLMCVGQGNIDVSNIYLGDTGSTTPDAGVVSWRAFKPADHRKTMGVIASAMGGGFHENVVSSPEVSNQEFIDTGDTAGFFSTCKAGNKGSQFQIDVIFPAGQTNPSDGGNINGRSTSFVVYYQELSDTDAVVGSVYSTTITASTGNGLSVSGPNVTAIATTTSSEKNQTVIGSPIRRSYMITVPRSARWSVKIVRITGAPNAVNGSDRFIWTGLRLYADYPTGTVYGDVTLLAVRVKASQGLGNDASARIRVNATRRLPSPAGGAEAATISGADAFADVYTNSVYGAARARSELDTTTLTSLRTLWSGYSFNYVFRDRITIWDALRTITTPFAAEPLPIGPIMSVAQDGVKAVRSMLFTDSNIVADTMSVSYSFDEEGATDGIEIEYINPTDFRPSYTKYPSSSLQPDKFSLPGVTDFKHAAQYARLTWQRRQGQRKRVNFDTELEGLLLQLGDRIGISHNVPKWGDGGLIIGVSGNVITVDHMLDWSGGAKQIMLRKADGSVLDPISVTRGTADNKVVLPSAPSIAINVDNAYDYNSFAFGSSTTLVRDFIVTTTSPTGDNTVSIEAVNYAPTIFSSGMSFLS